MRYLRATLNRVIADTDDDHEPVIAKNPVAKLNKLNMWSPTNPKTRHLRKDQIGPWLEAVQTGLVGIRHERELRDACMFFLLTGARLSEVLGDAKDGYPPLTRP
jgi:hypothetical protein